MDGPEPQRRRRRGLGGPQRRGLAGAAVLLALAGAARARPEPAGGPAPLAVRTVAVKRTDVVRRLEVAGEVQPFERVAIYAAVTGFVQRVLVDLGSEVEATQPLVEIDVPGLAARRSVLEAAARAARLEVLLADQRHRELQSARAQVEARHRAAQAAVQVAKVEERLRKARLDRFRALAHARAATPEELDEADAAWQRAEASLVTAQAEVAVRQAEIDGAKAAVARGAVEQKRAKAEADRAAAALAEHDALAAYAAVKAPFAGVISERAAHPGALVLGGRDHARPTLLLRLVRVDKVRVVVPVPETEARFLRVGAEAEVRGPGLEARPFAGTVARISGALESSNRARRVEIDATDRRLLPGQSVRVRLVLEVQRGVLTVPSAALHRERGRSFVWTADGQVARKVYVTVGIDDLARAEVEGITPDAHVVVGSRVPLREGMPLRGKP